MTAEQIDGYYDTPTGDYYPKHYAMFSFAGDAEVDCMVQDILEHDTRMRGGYELLKWRTEVARKRMMDISIKYPEVNDTAVREHIAYEIGLGNNYRNEM